MAPAGAEQAVRLAVFVLRLVQCENASGDAMNIPAKPGNVRRLPVKE
jgi:hypothetical protein